MLGYIREKKWSVLNRYTEGVKEGEYTYTGGEEIRL